MPAVPPAAWPQVKALFFAAHEAAPAERARLLADPAVDSTVRAYVETLLREEAALGDRFEAPAIAVVSGEVGDLPAWPEAPSLVGRRLGPYVVRGRVGQGGMGAVYEAARADGAYEGRVALKTLWRGADSDVLVHRFRTERQILAALQHPNIAQLLDGGATEEGTPYLVMEYVDGIPIDSYCDRHRLGVPARLDLFRQACAAVAHAHRHLVVHRDLKPSNVLVTEPSPAHVGGTVKLLDFGVAKLLDDPRVEGTLTGAGLSPFTTAYAAPEQVTGGRVSTATDVYALGALLTVLLAGRPPFAVEGLTAGEIVWAIGRGERMPLAPSVLALAAGNLAPRDGVTAAAARGFGSAAHLARALRGELDAIAGMALRDDPARRYATADALAEDVRRYLRRDRVLARPDTLGYRVRSVVRRRRALAAGVGVAAAALVAGSGVALWQARASRREAERSEQVARFLTRLFAGEDAATGDPIARLGARGTIAELLDSAVRRVPAAFPADARVRTRLYTAVGAHYTAQGRGREAAAVLDSAVRLARMSYGPRSDPFAAASLARADAVLGSEGPAMAAAHVDAALGALAGRERDAPDLYARALVLRARVLLDAGQVRDADALARRADALELARTRAPTITRAWAARVLGNTMAWIVRDPRPVAALHAHAAAIADSLGTPLARERIEALGELSEALLVLGRDAAADSAAALGLAAARAGYGATSVEYAALLARAAGVAGDRARTAADSVRAAAMADSAWRTAAALPTVGAQTLVDVAGTVIDDGLAHADTPSRIARARAVADILVARVTPQHVPVATIFAELYAGRARLAGHDGAGAERALRAAIAAIPASGDLDSILPRLRRLLAAALTAQGRRREADSVAALDPPSGRAVRCTPGGDWRGC